MYYPFLWAKRTSDADVLLASVNRVTLNYSRMNDDLAYFPPKPHNVCDLRQPHTLNGKLSRVKEEKCQRKVHLKGRKKGRVALQHLRGRKRNLTFNEKGHAPYKTCHFRLYTTRLSKGDALYISFETALLFAFFLRGLHSCGSCRYIFYRSI